jgi:hypothetical protein
VAQPVRQDEPDNATRLKELERVGAYRESHASDEPPLQLSERARLRELEGQYTSIRFTDHLDVEQIAPSIGSVGLRL